MRTTLLLLASLCACASPGAWGGAINKCKDAAGAVRYQEKPCAQEAQPLSAWAATAVTSSAAEDSAANAKELVIGAGRNGHYFVDGAINDHYINFIVDTGATIVSLPQSIAKAAGLKCEKLSITHTGNGAVQSCIARIQKLQIGAFILRHVDAVIMPNLDQPLLGMNVLSQFRVEQGDEQMRLTKKY